MTHDLVIRNGDVALPGREPERFDLAIRDGRIAAVLAPGEAIDARQTLDVAGLTVLPGVIDGHLHLGHGHDISRPRVADDAAGETAAAAVGGVTSFIPYLLSAEPYSRIADEVIEVTRAGARIDFGYHVVVATEDQLAEIPRYVEEYGIPTFKIFMNNRGDEGARLGLPGIDDGFLLRLCEAAAKNGGMVNPHPENIEAAWVYRARLMERDPDGKGGLTAWNLSRPPFVEADAVQRAGLFARIAGAPVYIVHTSSREALEAALRARDAGTEIYIETCPHYLTHNVEWSGGDVGKINPPVRDQEDCDALWEALGAGVIDTIATDHVHRDLRSKEGGIWKAAPGCPGLETLLPVMLSEGHVKRGLPISLLVDMLSAGPARIMGIGDRKGAIQPGYDADLAIVDLEGTTEVRRESVVSSAGYSIYEGWDLDTRVVHTLVRGRVVVRDGTLVEDSRGTGAYLKRALGG